MPKINVLPKSLAGLIAAGEVVERPASVIKELLENSIDAGATDITVEIKNGGVLFMRITDNGCGIEREDIRKAFLSHATSKISCENDLDSIATLGFRGEALASVAAVSKVELLTRTENEEIGTRYVIESGEEQELDDAGCPRGTTIVVRELFCNTPARMKFLKKDVSEGNAVAGVVDRIALSHPEISFRFIREGKPALITSGSGDVLSAAREIFGKGFSDTLIPVSGSNGPVSVHGYISVPHESRPNRNMQFFFINGRLVRAATASAALSEAYRNSVMVGKFPSCVLYIDMPHQSVDVNVHPAKTEVRFADEKSVFTAVLFACRSALNEDVSRAQYKAPAVKPVDYYAPIKKPAEQVSFYGNQTKSVDIPVTETANPVENIPITKPAMPVTAPVVFRSTPPVGYGSDENDTPSLIPKPVTSEPVKPVITEPAATPMPEVYAPDETVSEESVNEEVRVIGEAFRTYIIAEVDGKLVVIDKHAAHERMIYEELKSGSGEQSTQVLLAPVTVRLTKEEYSVILENREILRESGFEVEDFGDGAVIVSGCPLILNPEDINDVISELAGKFVAKSRDVHYEKLDHILHSVACRSAIKAGDFTSRLEMERFAKKLLSMPNIRYCPHGRPVLIEITRRELEKNFGRV